MKTQQWRNGCINGENKKMTLKACYQSRKAVIENGNNRYQSAESVINVGNNGMAAESYLYRK
jgi:hypothetical protein